MNCLRAWPSRKAGEMLNFAAVMTDGEPVLAASGERILGLGRVLRDPIDSTRKPTRMLRINAA